MKRIEQEREEKKKSQMKINHRNCLRDVTVRKCFGFVLQSFHRNLSIKEVLRDSSKSATSFIVSCERHDIKKCAFQIDIFAFLNLHILLIFAFLLTVNEQRERMPVIKLERSQFVIQTSVIYQAFRNAIICEKCSGQMIIVLRS